MKKHYILQDASDDSYRSAFGWQWNIDNDVIFFPSEEEAQKEAEKHSGKTLVLLTVYRTPR